MATRKLSVEITGNSRGGVNAMKDLSGAGDGMATKMGGVGKKVSKSFKYIGLAAVAGAAVVGKALFDAVGAARESAKINAETARVIQTTGAASWGASAKSVADYASELSNLTGVDDEIIQSGANLLLTFTNVQNKVGKGNDVFNQGVALANDMSTALGTDMKGASLQVGKALNDPIKGISALSRAGVSFTQEQKDQIKVLQNSGDTLGAQKIILGELSKEFGGAAAAAATPMDRLKVTLGNLQEEIGARLIPIIDKASVFIADNLPGALDKAGEFFGRLRDKVLSMRPAAEDLVAKLRSVVDAVVPVVQAIAGFIKQNPRPFLAALAVVVGGALVTALWAAAAGLMALLSPVVLVVAAVAGLTAGFVYAYQKVGWFRTGVDAAWQGIQAAISVAWSVIKVVFSALSGFITGTLIPTAQRLWSVAQTVFSAISTAISFAWNSIIKPVFSALSGFVTGVLMPIFRTFQGVAQVVFSVLIAVIRDAWEVIRPVFSSIVGFVRDQLMVRFELFKTVASTVFTAVSGAVSTAWNIVRPVFEAIVSFVRDKLSPVWKTISGAVSSAFNAIPGAIASALRIAGNLVAGFMRGVAGVADTIGLNNIAGALKSGAAKADAWGEGNYTPQKRGGAYGLAKGGYISGGTPGRDSVPAMLMPGEVVIRKSMVDRFGADNLLALNSGKVPGFGIGGIVDGIKSAAGGALNLGGSLLDKLRSVAAGALEKIWPEMGVANSILGLPAGGANKARKGIIDLVRGGAKMKQAAETAMESGRSGSSGLAGSSTGLNADFLSRFNAWNASVGGRYRIGSGFRSYASQQALYQKYLNGTGNLAARPGRSNHERGLAIDTSPRVSARDQALARAFKLHFPVRGEPWHIEPFSKGGRPPMGQASLVGELGPELFVPDSAGTIIPNKAIGRATSRRGAASGGGMTQVVNVYVTQPLATPAAVGDFVAKALREKQDRSGGRRILAGLA